MLRMCVPLASLCGNQSASNINSCSWRQQTSPVVHTGGSEHHSVQTGVTTAHGCRADGNSSAAGAVQQMQTWFQEQGSSHLSPLLRVQQQPEEQQQQQQQQQQASQLLSQQHQQASLMQGLVLLQQSVIQRSFSNSASAHNRHSIKPQLHQPMKHVSGTDPLKTLRATNSSSALGGFTNSTAEQQAADAAEAAAEPGSSSRVSIKDSIRQKWQAGCGRLQQQWQAASEAAGKLQDRVMSLPWGTMSTVTMKIGVCFTCTVAVYIIVQDVTLTGSSGMLATANADPSVQCLAVSRLHQLLWRPAWWPAEWAGDAAQQMVERGLLLQLAGLIKPGTDAVVLSEVFLLLQRLLESDDSMAQAVQQAGIPEALGKGLQEGWLPRGVLETAAALQTKLQLPKQQQQQQQQQQQPQKGKRRLPQIATGAGRAVSAAGTAVQR